MQSILFVGLTFAVATLTKSMVFLAPLLSAELRDDGNGQLTAPGPKVSQRHSSLHFCVCVTGNTLVCLLRARHPLEHPIHTDDSIPMTACGEVLKLSPFHR